MGLFNVFNKNEQAKNRSHIKNLIEVAISDGRLDDRELELINSVAVKFGISKEDALTIKQNHEDIEFTPPSSFDAKMKLMEDLVKVLLVDNVIEENEIKICKELAKKLRLSPYVVDDLINSILNQT